MKKKTFGEADFLKDVWKTMKDQERKDPAIALLHDRLEGEIQLIGLTGGIASGKSTVSGLLKKEGISVIDADEIARLVVRPGRPAYQNIVKGFGRDVVGARRALNRERLGKIVFEDESKRKLLESITHPEILKEITKRVRALRKKKTHLVVIDAALLFESGLDRYMHKTIVVHVDPEIQAERLMKRDGIAEDIAKTRILSQMPASERDARADIVLDNSGTPEGTQIQLQGILKSLLG